MDGYTCIKALVLGGVGFAAGDNIPAEAVLPGRVRTLIKQGYIAPANTQKANVAPELPGEAVAELQQQIADLQAELQQTTAERNELQEKLTAAEAGIAVVGDPIIITIPLTKEDGVLEVPASPESIVAAVCNLQVTAEESIKTIETMTDETALILIHALDTRKTVKAAAQARAETLGNQTDGDAPAEGKEDQGQGDA